MTKTQREPLTNSQADMLAAIAKYIKRHGYAPSVRDCGEAMGICSPKGVHHEDVDRRRERQSRLR